MQPLAPMARAAALVDRADCPLSLGLIGWRIPEGPLQRGDLLFDQPVTETGLAALASAIMSGDTKSEKPGTDYQGIFH